MRRSLATLLLGFLVLLPLSAAADVPAPNWTIFTDPDGVFTAEVPQPPTASTEQPNESADVKVLVKKYLVDRGESALLIVVSHFEGLSLDSETALDRAVKGTQTEDRTLDSDNPIVVGGHTGRSIVLHDKSGNRLTDRLFYFDNCLYQVITTVVPSSPGDSQSIADRFAETFRFLH